MIRKQIFAFTLFVLIQCSVSGQFAHQPFSLHFKSELSEDNKAFVESLVPDIIQANNEVLWLRKRIIEIRDAFEKDNHITTTSLPFLRKVSVNYKMDFDFSIFTTPAEFKNQVDRLLKRVDKVPEELVLAQAVLESEWGRSRFAQEANNFFGIRCYKPGCGIEPQGITEVSFMVRCYDTPLDGIRDYLYNLNVGSAYAAFREERAQQRNADVFPQTLELAQKLHGYSEIGDQYFTRVSWLIRRKLPEITLQNPEMFSQR